MNYPSWDLISRRDSISHSDSISRWDPRFTEKSRLRSHWDSISRWNPTGIQYPSGIPVGSRRDPGSIFTWDVDTMSTHYCVQAKLRPLPYERENQHFLADDQVVLIINQKSCNGFDRIPCLSVYKIWQV